MRDDKERNYFRRRIVLEVPLSHAKMCLKSASQKVNFLMAKNIQKSYTLNYNHKRPCTFPDSYA